jgi:hypothetical protein
MEDILPTEFELAQNYPNPFKGKTIIKYCVPEKMKIRLEVFDSNGNKIRVLVNEMKKAGTYKIEFKANDMDSGEYKYKLESKDYYEAKKMLLLE